MTDLGDQASLFDDAGAEPLDATTPSSVTAVEADAEATPKADGWFLPTNRHNILKMLAVRAVLTVEAFADKYYDDLLKLAPGRLPLVRGGMPSELAGSVAEDEFDFPILLEIEAEPDDGSHEHRAGDTWCPAGPIPFTMVRAIHFRTEDERSEFEQNEYADVRPARELHVVSPDRFASARPGLDVLGDLRAAEPASLPKSIDALDRRAGALILALLVGRQPGVEALVCAMRGDAARADTSDADGIVDWLADAAAASATAGERTTEALRAHRILAALEGVDRRQAWRPLEIIAALRDALPIGMPEAERHLIDGALTKATSILQSDEEFTGLKEGGSAALKALLLVLMRPEFERLNPTELHGQGIDDNVRMLAAAMLGAMTGRSRLPVEARPILLDDLLAHWECDQLRVLDNPTHPLPDLQIMRDGSEAWLTSGLERVVRFAADAPSPEPESVPPVEDEPGEAGISAALEAALVAKAAVPDSLRVATERGWWQAVLTTIAVRQGAAEASVHVDGDSAFSIVLRGHVEISQELDVQAFIALASEAADRDVIVTRLTEAGAKRRNPRTPKAKP